MPITTQEAADALNDIAHAQQRASSLRGYQRAAPHFILWGLIWIVGYGLSDFRPTLANPIWLALDLIGVSGSFVIGRATVARAAKSSTDFAWRYTACVVTFCAFVVATYYVMVPQHLVQFGAFPALIMATIYTTAGIWRGARWAAAGITLGALTLAGYALFNEHFMLWMAATGGGTLLLSGFWLRQP